MFCNQCGKQIPDDAKFCHHCGSAIGVEQNEETQVEVQAPVEEPVKAPEVPKAKVKKEKPATPGSKKKLILMAVAVVAILAIIIVGINIVKNHQKVLAELPDPEYFFAEEPIDEVNKHDDVKQVILRSSEENLWSQAAAYVDLLKWSGKYPVTQSDEESYSSGDYMWNFSYNNREDIKRPYFCQVEVNYYCKSNGRDVYAVWITIHDTDAFDLVEKEQYEEPVQTETAPSVESSSVGETESTDSSSIDSGTATESPIVSDSSDDSDDDDSSYEVPDASDIYDNPTPCGVCNRSGDCQTCSGDGYLMSSASDEEDRNCYSCSGSGNCRSCGGDGEL